MATSYVGSRSRIYVSSAIEATAGVASSLDTSFFVNNCAVNYKETQEADDVVTGYLAPISRTRIVTSATGNIAAPLHPAWAGWTLKQLFGSAPATSTLVSPSTTVYEHTWNAFTTPPATFTLMKQTAKIPTYTEQFSGNGLKSWSLKSGKKKVDLEVAVEGMGAQYTRGNAEPMVNPDTFSNPTTSLPYLVGVSTNLAVDGVTYAKGFFMQDWTVTVEPGYGLIDAAGSSDGSMTRFDVTGLRKITADFTLLEQSRANLDDFINQTVHDWTFSATGPLLDQANGLPAFLSIQLNKARMIDMWPSEVGKHGVYMIKMKIESLIDTATGFDTVVKLHSLATTY